jgi:PhnB protein
MIASKNGKVNPIPDGYHTLTPYLYMQKADEAIRFYEKAFNAKELFRMEGENGKIAHAEMQIGNSRIMLSEENPKIGAFGPLHYGGSAAGFLLYVEDMDAVHAQALAAGAKEERKPTDQFYGDRSSTVVDPFGHKWYLSTHIEDVSPEEMDRRMSAQKVNA